MPAVQAQLQAVRAHLLAAQTAMTTHDGEEVALRIQNALEILSAMNFEAMWSEALKSVDGFAHPLFAIDSDTRVQSPAAPDGLDAMVDALAQVGPGP
jgi:hypothetical protein